jgi:tetratricopeptide (TPR) repeat protein
MPQSPDGGTADVSSRVERALERCLEWSQQGRHRKVLTEVERLLTLVRDDSNLVAQLLIWKAQALLTMGYAERALPAASESWRLQSSPHACHLMASALNAVGDPEQSEELLRMGSELFPDAIHLPMQLAMMLADQGRLPEALDILNRVSPAPQLPEDMQVFLVGLRANLLATVGRWSEADAVLREGLGRHPESSLLLEAHDTLSRQWDRSRAENRLVESWRSSIEPLDGVGAEVDDSIIRCGSVMELPDLTVIAARRLWRAYVRRGVVRLQSPHAWSTALVLAVLELDGHRTSAAAMARAMAVRPATVRAALRRLRRFIHDQEVELARRAFGAYSNPRLDDPASAASDGAEIVAFPSPREN